MAEQRTYDTLLDMTIGNYRPEQLLGQSKYGPIFLARSVESGTQYIMRFLAPPADLVAEARIVYLGLFQQEANRVAMLQHPHILPLHDYGNFQGMPYLVLPNYPTRTLRNQLAKYGPLDALTASRTLDQIAAALEFAHQHAVLHRNLSTESILLDRREKLSMSGQEQHGTVSNSILVTDFSIMRMLELSRQDGQASRIYGSSESIAPEQILGSTDKPVDTSTDVYALGAVMYRMLTGHPVFTGKSREDILQQHVQAPVPPLNVLEPGKLNANDPNFLARMSGLLAKAMAKDPVYRFQHPGELANAFHALAAPNDTTRKAFAIAVPQPVQSVQNVVAVNPAAPIIPLSRRHQLRRRRINRRNFIAIGGGTVAVAAIAILLGSHYLSPAVSPTGNTGSATTGSTSPAGSGRSTPSGKGGSTPAPTHSGTVIARTTDVPLNSAKTFPIANSSNPGILVHLSNNRFVAFNSTCTHAGCAVVYSQQDKLLECPCHQATFDPANNAAVVQGPATTPLAPIAVTVNADGTITTH